MTDKVYATCILIYALISLSITADGADNTYSVPYALRPILVLDDFRVVSGGKKYIITERKKDGRYLCINSMNWAEVIHYLGEHIHSLRRKVIIRPHFYFRDTRSVVAPRHIVITLDRITQILSKHSKKDNHSDNLRDSLASKVPDASGRYRMPTGRLSVQAFGAWICPLIYQRKGYIARYLCRLIPPNDEDKNQDKGEIELFLALGPDDIVPCTSWNIYITRRVRIVAQLPGTFDLDSAAHGSVIARELPPYGNGIAFDPQTRVLTLVVQKNDAQVSLRCVRDVFGGEARIDKPDLERLFPWIRYEPMDF